MGACDINGLYWVEVNHRRVLGGRLTIIPKLTPDGCRRKAPIKHPPLTTPSTPSSDLDVTDLQPQDLTPSASAAAPGWVTSLRAHRLCPASAGFPDWDFSGRKPLGSPSRTAHLAAKRRRSSANFSAFSSRQAAVGT